MEMGVLYQPRPRCCHCSNLPYTLPEIQPTAFYDDKRKVVVSGLGRRSVERCYLRSLHGRLDIRGLDMGLELPYHHHTLGLLWPSPRLFCGTVILRLLHQESPIPNSILKATVNGAALLLYRILSYRTCSYSLLYPLIFPVYKR